MIRPVLTEIGIFLIPFAVYAVFLIATRTELFIKPSLPLPHVGWPTVGALVLVVLSFLLLASFSGSPPVSPFVPAHIEYGKLIRRVDK